MTQVAGESLPDVFPVHTAADESARVPFRHRPRALYFAVFVWISVTGGRFLASFLEHEATGATAATIGGLLALQRATSVLASSPSGALADWMEGRRPGLGRQSVLSGGVLLGTFCFCLNGCHRIFPAVPAFQSLVWYGLLRTLYAVCLSLVMPVLDGICLDFLKRHGTPNDYGRERLFGAVSWALTNLVIGPVLDRFQDFAFLYPAAVAATVLVLVTVKVNVNASPPHNGGGGHQRGIPIGVVPDSSGIRHPGVKRRTSDLPLDDVDCLLEGNDGHATSASHDGPSAAAWTSRRSGWVPGFLFTPFGSSCYSVTFLIALVTLAAGQSIVNDLVFLFFEYLGSSFSLMSFTVVLTVAFEIPIFHVAPKLLELVGPSGLVFIASSSYILRVLAYTLVPVGETPWVLLLEPLHGVTYACSQTAAVDFATKLIPEQGREATGQGVLQFFTGMGSVLGLTLGGWMEDVYGPRWMYRVSALVVMVGSGIFAAAHLGQRPGWGVDSHSESRSIRHHIVPQDDGDEVDSVAGDGPTIEMRSSPVRSP